MTWEKLGLIFNASGQTEQMITGGRAPVPLLIGDDDYRVYFASYDMEGRGRIFYLELNLGLPQSINALTTQPVIDIGATGHFDDNGIIPSDVVSVGGLVYLYTIGFSVKNRLMFDAASGLAISEDRGVSFRKLHGPVLDRGVDDPCFAASPTVMREDSCWRMWYVSCDRWEPKDGGYRHFYNIKHRYSSDGIYWEPRASVCIDYENTSEYAISRPSVIRDADGLYRMWYSFRAQPNVSTYRIGYAESQDGLNWTRMDSRSGIDISDAGWDSEMICYPRVFKHQNYLYMLYNGNGYGRSGFGLARMKDPQ
jgi:hypothetical protein